VVDATVRIALQEFRDRGGGAERFQQLNFRVRQGNEHGGDTMLGLRDGSRHRGAQGVAIDPGGGRDVAHRDRHVIELADHA